MPASRNLLAAEGEDLLGKGLLLGHGGYRVLHCLSAIESTASAGQTDVTVEQVDPENVTDLRLGAMMDRIYDPKRGKGPLAIHLKIAITGVGNDLSERSSTLRPDVQSDVDASQAALLFDACGTKLITAVRRRAQLDFLFVVYPRTRKEQNTISLILNRSLGGPPQNTMRSTVFNALAKFPFRSILRTDSDAILTPLDFPLGRWKGRGIGDLLPKVSRLLLQAKSGPISDYTTRPWRMTPLAQNTVRSQLDDPHIGLRREQNFIDSNFTNLLIESARRRMGQAAQARAQVQWFLRADQCQKRLKEQLSDETLEGCIEGELPLASSACRQKLRILDQTLLNSACAPLPMASEDSEDPLLLESTRQPMIAKPIRPAKGKAQPPPASIPFGLGLDRTGKVFEAECIQEKLDDHIDENRATIETEIALENNLPDERTRWQIFWRKPKPPFERVDLNVRQVSRSLLPSFELTKKAKELAQSNLRKFFKRCGTHYVRGGIHRRGLLINLYKNGEQLSIHSQSRGLSKKAASSPILADPRLERLLYNQAVLKQLFEGAEQALTEQLHLEPWTDYLLLKSVIKLTDLDPSTGR